VLLKHKCAPQFGASRRFAGFQGYHRPTTSRVCLLNGGASCEASFHRGSPSCNNFGLLHRLLASTKLFTNPFRQLGRGRLIESASPFLSPFPGLACRSTGAGTIPLGLAPVNLPRTATPEASGLQCFTLSLTRPARSARELSSFRAHLQARAHLRVRFQHDHFASAAGRNPDIKARPQEVGIAERSCGLARSVRPQNEAHI
jgi:hypothetical protein